MGKILEHPTKKITSKNVTAKMYCIIYVQLDFLRTICETWKNRIDMGPDQLTLVTMKFDQLMK